MIAERLKAARLVAGLTQAELAHRLGVTNVAVSKYERGLVVPDGERLVQLSEALGVSVAQLLRQQAELRVSTASFRWHPLQRRSRRVAEEVEAKVCEWLERYVALEQLLGERPSVGVGDLRAAIAHTHDPEEAAVRLRGHWRLGGDAIESMVDVLEDNGIKVLALPEAGSMNACSYEFNEGQLAIAVSRSLPENGADCPGDRERFSLAHELGHFLLDNDADQKVREATAHRFAAAFLVPAEAAYRELGEARTEIAVSELSLLKRKYGLSMQAWIRRSRELGILSPTAAKTALAAAKGAGWEEKEPMEVAFEEPQRMLRLALRAWAEGIVSESRAAELSACPRERFRWMRSNAWEAVDAGACA
jgi:Zn-dependent peptidase ImmA (M78 family)/transcriptional regulator with XRE-family HTH domain